MTNYQVMQLVRDSRVAKNAERLLLDALAMRCNPKLCYSALTSYKQLANDTLLSIPTLRHAAQRLERSDIIRRSPAPNPDWESAEEQPTIRIHLNIKLLKKKADAINKAEAVRRAEAEHVMFANPFLRRRPDQSTNGDSVEA